MKRERERKRCVDKFVRDERAVGGREKRRERRVRDKSPDASVSANALVYPRRVITTKLFSRGAPVPRKTVNRLTFIALPRIMPSLSSPLIEYGVYNLVGRS